MAEVIEAAVCGMHSSMVVYSETALDRQYNRLSEVKLIDCQASREEDKQGILAKVDDHEAFDVYLQWLVFNTDGFLKPCADAQGTMETIGRIARRAAMHQSQGALTPPQGTSESSARLRQSIWGDSHGDSLRQSTIELVTSRSLPLVNGRRGSR